MKSVFEKVFDWPSRNSTAISIRTAPCDVIRNAHFEKLHRHKIWTKFIVFVNTKNQSISVDRFYSDR